MSERWFHRAVADAVEQGDDFGRGSGGERVLVEFVSANPTGPMTVASARGAAIGDSLARLLEFAGNEVEREYYINDYGTQVRLLRRVDPRPRARRGAARGRLPGRLRRGAGGRDRGRRRARREELARAGVEHMMERVGRTLERFRVHFDRFFSERAMYETAPSSACSSSSERATSTSTRARAGCAPPTFGDDKDSVLIRSSGEPTYFASDIAYHEDKRERGFDRVINIWGADHHGHVKRMHAAWRRSAATDGRSSS